MGLSIFGKKEVEEALDRLEEKVDTLENQVSADLIKHVGDIEKKLTNIEKAQAGLTKKMATASGDVTRLKNASQKNTGIIERQVEEAIPVELGMLRNDAEEINAKLEAMRVILDKVMGILKQVTDPANKMNQKVLKLEDQIEAMGRIDLIHLVDKLEIIKEQLQKAQGNFLPPEVEERLRSLDVKLHQMGKRLEEVEDQMIRPIEDVV